MRRKVSYIDCLHFIEHYLHIELLAYQREIIKCFCEGKEVRVPKLSGRTLCAESYGKYIAHLLDKNDNNTKPDVLISCPEGKTGYHGKIHVDEEPYIEFKNGSYIKVNKTKI